jgi:hypothetical protein
VLEEEAIRCSDDVVTASVLTLSSVAQQWGFPSLQLRTGLACLGFMRSLVARQSLDYVPAAPPIYIVLREKDPLPTERHVLPIKIREEILPKPGQIFLICKRSHSSHIPPLCSQCSKREHNTTTILR